MQHSEKAQFYKPALAVQGNATGCVRGHFTSFSFISFKSHAVIPKSFTHGIHDGCASGWICLRTRLLLMGFWWPLTPLHTCAHAHPSFARIVQRGKKCSLFKLCIYFVLTLKQIYIWVELLNITLKVKISFLLFFLTTTLTLQWNRAFFSFLFSRFLFVALALCIWS